MNDDTSYADDDQRLGGNDSPYPDDCVVAELDAEGWDITCGCDSCAPARIHLVYSEAS